MPVPCDSADGVIAWHQDILERSTAANMPHRRHSEGGRRRLAETARVCHLAYDTHHLSLSHSMVLTQMLCV